MRKLLLSILLLALPVIANAQTNPIQGSCSASVQYLGPLGLHIVYELDSPAIYWDAEPGKEYRARIEGDMPYVDIFGNQRWQWSGLSTYKMGEGSNGAAWLEMNPASRVFESQTETQTRIHVQWRAVPKFGTWPIWQDLGSSDPQTHYHD